NGSVALPVAGYDYNSDWTPLLAGLSPAEMAASLAAPKPTETTPNAEAVPARPGAERHALDHKPRGILDCSRQLDASRSGPDHAAHAGHPWRLLDFRWTRGAVEIE